MKYEDEKIYACEKCKIIAEKGEHLKRFCEKTNDNTCEARLHENKMKAKLPDNNN